MGSYKNSSLAIPMFLGLMASLLASTAFSGECIDHSKKQRRCELQGCFYDVKTEVCSDQQTSGSSDSQVETEVSTDGPANSSTPGESGTGTGKPETNVNSKCDGLKNGSMAETFVRQIQCAGKPKSEGANTGESSNAVQNKVQVEDVKSEIITNLGTKVTLSCKASNQDVKPIILEGLELDHRDEGEGDATGSLNLIFDDLIVQNYGDQPEAKVKCEVTAILTGGKGWCLKVHEGGIFGGYSVDQEGSYVSAQFRYATLNPAGKVLSLADSGRQTYRKADDLFSLTAKPKTQSPMQASEESPLTLKSKVVLRAGKESNIRVHRGELDLNSSLLDVQLDQNTSCECDTDEAQGKQSQIQSQSDVGIRLKDVDAKGSSSTKASGKNQNCNCKETDQEKMLYWQWEWVSCN